MKKLLTIIALALGVSVNAQTGNTATGAQALQDNTTGGIIGKIEKVSDDLKKKNRGQWLAYLSNF